MFCPILLKSLYAITDKNLSSVEYNIVVIFSDYGKCAYMYKIVLYPHGLDHARIVEKWTNDRIRYLPKSARGRKPFALLVTHFSSARPIDPQSPETFFYKKRITKKR